PLIDKLSPNIPEQIHTRQLPNQQEVFECLAANNLVLPIRKVSPTCTVFRSRLPCLREGSWLSKVAKDYEERELPSTIPDIHCKEAGVKRLERLARLAFRPWT